MKAVFCDRYGPPESLRVGETATPAPRAGEVLVRIHATTVTSGDARMRAFNVPPVFKLPGRFMLGFSGPRNPILGFDFAGVVEAVGPGASRFGPGDRVFGGRLFGLHAEYAAIAETGPIETIPQNLSFEEAAAVPFGALTAMHFLRKAKVGAGTKIAIVGAVGAVGVFALQLAKHLGAEVTAVVSGPKTGLVLGLGADHAVDYTKEDFCALGRVYDVIFDCVGATTFKRCRTALAPDGRHVFLVSNVAEIVQAMVTAAGRGQKVIGGESAESPADLAFVRGLLEQGKVRPVIDRRLSGLEAIPEGHRIVDTGRKTGAVVVSLAAA